MKQLFSAAMDSTWTACLYFGLFHGIGVALAIGLFIAWAMFAFSFFSFNKDVAEVIGHMPARAVVRSVIFDFAAIGMLAWHGWTLTAVAATLASFIYFVMWANNREGVTA